MAILDKDFTTEKVGEVATLTYADTDAFKNGTELPMSEMKKVFDYAHDYIEKATERASVEATKIMEKDKKINKVIVSYPYGMSKRGEIGVTAKRSQTFKSPADNSEVTKSTLAVVVHDPLSKVSKAKVKALSATMTASLLS